VPDQKTDNPSAIPSGLVVILCGEEEVRDVLAYWLTALPVPTIVTADGRHADQILRDNPCKLLVTDRILPPWPGLETFRKLRDDNPQLRIAFVESGNLDERILARIVGVTDCLQRPLSRKAVIDTLIGRGAAK
jgi:DNA-binding response OmpR family regulator